MNRLHLAGAVARLSTPGHITVTRPVAGTDDGHGRRVEGSPTTFTIHASVQPVTGRELMRLPEGLRTRELVAVFSPDELRTVAASKGVGADTLRYEGATYEVQLVEDWHRLGGYWRVVAAKVER